MVFTGDLMEMPNGLPIGMAVGFNGAATRCSSMPTTLPTPTASRSSSAPEDFEGKENVYAAFVELAVPVTEQLDLQIAGRYEEFDVLDDNTFDPKITAMFRATEDLTLRASAGTSFRVGSLVQRFGSSTQLINIADPYSGASLAFRPEIAQGNANLSPEEAVTWNVGFSRHRARAPWKV
ncbi:MAG: TonB-dependent receptor [Gammaproteobacteria bacterium]|nr:TonB-dependent receptor [Gammaproteobacteria bacterium]